MARRRRRIPALTPDGTVCRPSYDYAAPAPRRHRSHGERLEGEPWRRDGYGRGYAKARQQALDATHGTCAICGKRIAHDEGGRWVMDCGEVHHVRALSEGGGHEVGNLMPLCVPCHRKEDQRRRDAHARR